MSLSVGGGTGHVMGGLDFETCAGSKPGKKKRQERRVPIESSRMADEQIQCNAAGREDGKRWIVKRSAYGDEASGKGSGVRKRLRSLVINIKPGY